MFAAGKTAAVSGAGPDAQFNYVTMLLHGDGTNGAQNNTFLDSSTNNFTITRNGNTTQGSFSPYGSNWSNFNPDSDNGIGVATNTALNMGSGDFTVEAWVNTAKLPTTNAFQTSSGGYQSVFGTGPNSSSSGTQLYIGVTNLKFDINSDGGGPIDVAHNMVAGQWYHVAISRSSTTFKAFINGSLVQTATSGNSWVDGYSYGIMRAEPIGGYGGAWWYGYVSNLRLIKGTAIYTSSFTPSTTPLTAISGTSLLTCQSNRFIDNSASPLTITVNGTPSVQRFNPFGASTAYSTSVIGGSGYFDGSGDYLTVPSSSVFAFGTGNFTIEAWVYPLATYVDSVIKPSSNNLNLYIDGSGFPAVYLGGAFTDLTGSKKANNFSWNHLAISRSSGTLRLFLNGELIGSTASTPSYGTVSLTVGNSGTDFNAYLSDLRVVSTALYTSGFTVPTAPVPAVANTQLLLNFTNGAIFDNAMMNDLETVGNAQISTSVVKYGTGSMAFDGTGDGLYRPPTPNLDFGTGNFTIEWWMYFSSKSGFQTIMSYGYTPETSTGWLIQTGSGDGKIVFYKQSGGVTVASDTGSTVNTGEWYHMAVVRNSGTTTIYRNGTSVGSGSDTNNYVATTAKFYLGGGSSTAFDNFFFNGYIDDLRITKGYARYTATFTPPTAALPDIGPN